MELLHTQMTERFLRAVADRLAVVEPPIVVRPLDGGSSPALLIGATLNAAELAAAQEAGVRWIQAVSAGVENILIPELVESDIVLSTTGGMSAVPIAEFVFARILEHAKQLRRFAELQAAHTWKATPMADLRGSTLTVIGLGPIGVRVAELGKAFGMRVLAVRRRPGAGAGPCDEVVGTDGLVMAMTAADYVVLAPALTGATRRLLGGAELGAMREGALLVNVGRGDLIDEQALLELTKAGRFVAALDVVANEPLDAESPLWECEAVRISPHCSTFTPSLLPGLADVIVDNVQRFVTGRPLLHVVDKAAGYPVAEPEATGGVGEPEATGGRP